MNRPSFYWFDDAVEAAILIGQQTGRKQRVFRVPGASNSWQIAPAFLRAVPSITITPPQIDTTRLRAEIAKVLARPARFPHIGGI